MRAIKNIIGATFISIAVLVFWVFILPGYEMQNYLKSSVEIRSSALVTKSELIQKVSNLSKEYQDKFNELKRLSLVVPSKKDIAEVITSIEDISLQSGINLSGLTISESRDLTNTKPYGNLALDFGFSGNYESVLSLLEHIERHIRIIDINSLGLSIKEDETIGSQIILAGSLKASLYFLKSVAVERPVTRVPTDEN